MAAPETQVRATAALDDLYRRHVGDVYRYTYAVLGNHADAEDVTQTTFVNALRALERGEQPRDPSAWLLAISHNIVRQRWRQAAVRPTEVELVYDVAESSTEPDVELDELVRALQRIPPAQREALVMREMEGRSYREISELLGLSTSALETLLFRARRSLAEELENLVTCQGAELAISKRLDSRLSRKERRRLDDHLAECASCARLAETQGRQRKAFKGLAVLPIPVGLALFKGIPTASAAALPTIGGGSATGTGIGATGVGATGATGAGGASAGAGSVAAGGSFLGGAAAKVAAVVVAGTVATGIGYEGVKAVTTDPPSAPAKSSRVSSDRSTPRQGPTAVALTRAKSAGTLRQPVAKTAVPTGAASGVAQSGGTSAVKGVLNSAPDNEPATPAQDSDGRAADSAPPDVPRQKPGPRPSPPVATPTPTETPAGTPTTTPPDTSGASESAPPTSAPESPPASAGSENAACPGGGNGPGNGSGCGLAKGHESSGTTSPATSDATATTPDTTATSEGASASDAGGKADLTKDKPDKS
jgi:RNA polymerase sigma factor (sigma-70 family)